MEIVLSGYWMPGLAPRGSARGVVGGGRPPLWVRIHERPGRRRSTQGPRPRKGDFSQRRISPYPVGLPLRADGTSVSLGPLCRASAGADAPWSAQADCRPMVSDF